MERLRLANGSVTQNLTFEKPWNLDLKTDKEKGRGIEKQRQGGRWAGG